MTGTAAKIQAIYRYPVKGLSPEPLPRTDAGARQDRAVRPHVRHRKRAVRLRSGQPGYLPKQRFLMLMRNARLAELRTAFDDDEPCADDPLGKPRGGAAATSGHAEGRAAIEQFFAGFCADELRGPPKVLQAEGHSFSDVAKKVVSIINLASVAALETVDRRAGRIRCAFAAISTSRAGRPGTSSICSNAEIAIGRRAG